jgi:cystathionine gamma-synthase
MDIKTRLAQAGILEDEVTGAVSAPIYQTATFIHRSGMKNDYEYSRTANPTRRVLEKAITALEGGYRGFAFSSGMAAITAVLSIFRSGDRIIASDDLYGGTYRLFERIFSRFGINVNYVDTSDPEGVRASIDSSVKALFIETPSNPTMKITDLRAMAAIAREHGLKLIVDSTFMTPVLLRPIELGAHIVIHSGTKYLGGHNDTLCGIAVCADAADSENISFIQNTTGAVLSPFDSWLVLRGLKTLALRVERAQYNAEKIARWLGTRGEVTDVFYPGLADFKGADIHFGQCSGAGGMIAFRLKDKALADSVISNCGVIRFAESLGGVETLVTRPSTQTHSFMPEELRSGLGITYSLLRLSTGIEEVHDLILDLKKALEKNIK